MGAKRAQNPPSNCLFLAKGTLKMQGFRWFGFISGPRGPQFKSGRPDQHSKALSTQTCFSKSTTSYNHHIFHNVLTTFDATSRFSAETA